MGNQQGNVLDHIGYTIGLLLGDGNLYADPYKGDYRMSFANGDKETLLRAQAECEAHLALPARPINRIGTKLCFELTYYSKDTYMDMVHLTEFKRAVPAYYLSEECPSTVRQSVLAGLLDSDGSIRVSKRRLATVPTFELNFYNNELGLIDGTRRLCKLLGIRTRPLRSYVNAAGRVSHDLGLNLSDYAARGAFHCKRKAALLQQYREQVKGRWPTRPSETKPTAPFAGDDIVQAE